MRVATVVSVLLFVTVTASILVTPALPSLRVKTWGLEPPMRAVSESMSRVWASFGGPLRFKRERRTLLRFLAPYADRGRREGPLQTAGSSVGVRADRQPLRIAFLVNWDDNSFASLKRNIRSLDVVIPEWLHLQQPGGVLTQDDPINVAYGEMRPTITTYIRTHRRRLRIEPLVNNYSESTQSWDTTDTVRTLADPSARRRLILGLLSFVQSNRYAGIHIDFENLPDARSHRDLVTFMGQLYGAFHAAGLEVSESVPVDEPAFPYRALASRVDFLVLMAYDQHAAGSDTAGPLAAQSWFLSHLRPRFAQLPPSKLVIALGDYGYDWTGKSLAANELTFQQTMMTAHDSRGQPLLDPLALNPHFDYYDSRGRLHHVWYLDAATAFNEIADTKAMDPRGYALWRLGSEDPAVFKILGDTSGVGAPLVSQLRTLSEPLDIDYEGAGEILRVTGLPRGGSRTLTFDPKMGLVTGERITSFPAPYVITRWGALAEAKKIALTFDDGPDPTWTPQILTVLERYRVPATFFVIGANADLNQGLLHRIVNDGSELGNHTFTHPNIAAVSLEQVKMEVDATERLFESVLGIRSMLFRPPYAEDIEPATPEQVPPVAYTTSLGYYTVGLHIDPSDWRAPGVGYIVKKTIEGAVSGKGQIVLLHDSGGDRSQTVAALPGIIGGLRARGFKLVTISGLLNLPRAAVMAPVPSAERPVATIDSVAFTAVDWGSQLLALLFGAGIVLGALRFVFVGSLAVLDRVRERNTSWPDALQYHPSVSILVPAHNEEKVVCTTVDALLHSDYPDLEVIVVDDGSTDRTTEVLAERFADDPRVRIVTRASGGKAAALNHGVNLSHADIVVALDADTVFLPKTLGALVRHFSDPVVGAVAGNTKVGNRVNLLTAWQALEYITSQNLDRRAFNVLNCIAVVPGAVGAWRRDLVVQAGGFAADTLAEDADLTLTILREGHRINYEDEAIAFTEAPDTIKGFVRQRFRWMYGTLQAVVKHSDTLFRPRYGALGIVAIPNVFIFQILFPLISPVMDLVLVLSAAWVGWQAVYHPGGFSIEPFARVLIFYGLFLLFEFGTAALAFALEKGEDWRLLEWLFFMRFVYRQLMYYVAIKSTLTAIRGSAVNWVRVERKATLE